MSRQEPMSATTRPAGTDDAAGASAAGEVFRISPEALRRRTAALISEHGMPQTFSV